MNEYESYTVTQELHLHVHWLHGTAAERRSLASELRRPAFDL